MMTFPIHGKHNLLNHQPGISYTHNIHRTIDGILVATLAHAARFGQTHVDFSTNKKHKQAAGGCTKVIYYILYIKSINHRILYPRCSMYGISTYIYLKNGPVMQSIWVYIYIYIYKPSMVIYYEYLSYTVYKFQKPQNL